MILSIILSKLYFPFYHDILYFIKFHLVKILFGKIDVLRGHKRYFFLLSFIFKNNVKVIINNKNLHDVTLCNFQVHTNMVWRPRRKSGLTPKNLLMRLNDCKAYDLSRFEG